MDIDSQSYSSNNTISSLDILSSEVDYINNNNINQTNYLKHKEKKKSSLRDMHVSDFFDGTTIDNDNEISDNEIESRNALGKLNNDMDEDSDDNEDNDDDNDDNDDDNDDNDDDNENDDENDGNNDDDNDDENDDDSNDEENNDEENNDESENSDNDNEDSNVIDEDENTNSFDEVEKESENKLKLRIKLKRNDHSKIEKDRELISKDKSNFLIDIENDIKHSQSVDKKDEKHFSDKKISESSYFIDESNKKVSKTKSSNEIYQAKDNEKILINQTNKNILYSEPISMIEPSSVVPKAPRKSVSISKGRKSKKSIQINVKGKVKILKKPKKIDLMEILNKVLKVIKGLV